jgi:hypothetical protein
MSSSNVAVQQQHHKHISQMPRALSPSAATLAALVAGLVVGGARAEQTFNRVNLTAAAANGAVCLDGSVPIYYLWKGDPTKWLVFFMGGGWCYNEEQCAERALTYVGSARDFASEQRARGREWRGSCMRYSVIVVDG